MGARAVKIWAVWVTAAVATGCAATGHAPVSELSGAQELTANPDPQPPVAPPIAPAQPPDWFDRMSISDPVPFTPQALVGKPWAAAERLARANGWPAVVVDWGDGVRPAIAYDGRRIEVTLKDGVVQSVQSYPQ